MAQTLHLQDNGTVLVVLPSARPVPVDEWVDKQKTGRQLRDPITHLPLWEIACAADLVRFDNREAEIFKVRYASETGEVPASLYATEATK